MERLAGVYDFSVHSPLSAHRFLLRASLAAANVFAWILLFDAFVSSSQSLVGALGVTAIVYAGAALSTLLLTPIAGTMMRNGIKRTMTIAIVSYVLALDILAAVFLTQGSWDYIFVSLVAFAFCMGAYRAFYFVPYSLAAEEEPHPSWFSLEMLLALVPAGAGLILVSSTQGYLVLFAMAGILALFSLLPISSIPDIYERYAWQYSVPFRALVSRQHRKLFTACVCDGIHGAGLLFVWPITALLLLSWSYFLLGVVLSVTFIAAICLREALQHLHARHPRSLALISVSSWVVRFSAFSPVTIALADVMYYSSAPKDAHGIDMIAGEHPTDGGLYIDEMTALKEMALALGRITLAIIVIVCATFATLDIALMLSLALAALAAIVSHYAPRSERVI